MVEWVLEYIVCPSCASGDLVISDQILPVIRKSGCHEDILEGTLYCLKCGKACPILCGVAIVVANVNEYILLKAPEITATALKLGLSDEAKKYIFRNSHSFYSQSASSQSWETTAGIDMYVMLHYGRQKDRPGITAALKNLLSAPAFIDVYSHCADIQTKYATHHDLALDIGTNVGGLAFRLAMVFEQVIAVDFSFRAAATARSILRHSPHKIEKLEPWVDGVCFSECDVELPGQINNLEIIVSDAQRLPFRDNCFDAISAMHLLELVAKPKQFIAECARIQKTTGSFLHASPYYWRPDRSNTEDWLSTANMSSGTCLRSTLASHGQQIIHEDREMLWPLLINGRYLQIWVSDLVISKKTSD